MSTASALDFTLEEHGVTLSERKELLDYLVAEQASKCTWFCTGHNLPQHK